MDGCSCCDEQQVEQAAKVVRWLRWAKETGDDEKHRTAWVIGCVGIGIIDALHDLADAVRQTQR